MPALNLTKVLYLTNKIDTEIIGKIKEHGGKSNVYTTLLQLLNAENAKQQIEQLKKVVGDIGKQFKVEAAVEEDIDLIGRFLVHLFIISTTKNPLRRVVISSFQGFPESFQISVITPHIENALHQIFQSLNEVHEECISTEECLNLRHNVDTIAALIENFCLGEACVVRLCLSTLAYLCHLLQIFYKAYGSHLSPVQQNEVMHHCLETVKLANRVIQRSTVAMETNLKDSVTMENFIETVIVFMTTDIKILQKDSFLLDCKTTSSMNICLMLKHTDVGPRVQAMLANTAFQHVDWFYNEHGQMKLPDWLEGLDIDQLKPSRLSSSSYLCLCYGILTMLDMEEQLRPVNGKCLLLDVLLPELLILTKRCTDVGSKLLASKSICVLSQKVRTYLQKNRATSCDPTILQRFNGESGDMKTILDYVWTSWEDSVDAIRFTVKDLFENVVAIHATVSPTGQNKDLFLQHLTQSILRDVNWSCKGKYGTLAVLVSHVGSARMLAMHDGIAGEILDQLREHTLSCYASDLYETLFLFHKAQLTHGSSHSNTFVANDNTSVATDNSIVANDNALATVWHRTWTDPVIAVLCGSHKLQKKHAIEYILPKLLKTGPGMLQYMIRTLSTRIDQPTQCGYDKMLLTQTENQLGALVMCLRRARVMGQLKTSIQGQDHDKGSKVKVKGDKKNVKGEEVEGQSQGSELKVKEVKVKVIKDVDEGQMPRLNVDQGQGDNGRSSELWCGVVSVELLQKALICKDEQIRLDAFALLCENQKTSETLTDTELKLVQTFIPQNLNSHNPAFRQVLLSHLKKMFDKNICRSGVIVSTLSGKPFIQVPSYQASYDIMFLSRMKESTIALKRQIGKDKNAHGCLMAYKDFLAQLTRHLLVSLYPGCVFAKRTTCLGALSIIMNHFSTTASSHSDSDFLFHAVVRPCDILSLLDCLTDTYEDNKREASDILISCSQADKNTGVMDEKMTVELTEIAFQLSQSTRPQDCMTAAYLFKVLLHQLHIHNVLRKIGSGEISFGEPGEGTLSESRENTFGEPGEGTLIESRESATRVTENQTCTGEQIKYSDSIESEVKNIIKPTQSRETHIKSTGNFDKLTVTKEFDTRYKIDVSKFSNLKDVKDDELGRRCILLHMLLSYLEDQVNVAKSNLIVAAANRPIYPTMLCMRYCLMEVNYRNIPAEMQTVWQRYFERFISLCLEISEIVSPVVQNSSPEGNVPLDKIPGGAMMLEGGNESLARSRDTVMLMPEYLIVCCWRSTKEISLIFGQLTTDLPIASPVQPQSQTNQSESKEEEPKLVSDQSNANNDLFGLATDQSDSNKLSTTSRQQQCGRVGLLSIKQVLEIGAYFTTQLLESVHRGAFELAYAGFVKLTDMLWRSSVPELHHLPKQWLQEVMEDIKSGSSESRLCATRRSAGVPFYVQALVSTEPTSTGRVCFRDTMQQLLTMAFDETMATADSCSAKVHALNILRALYKDSRLKDDVAPYVADGLKVAILGFKSALWAVRNSATLLMTAMMTRIFGVKRSRDESSFSKKNCQTGKTFFFKYPALYQFLLDQLTEVTSDLTTQLHPGLYPILMVLGRLFPSTMEGTDTSLNLAAFIPLVIKCSSSPVLKTRIMAARALQPLVEKDHVTTVFIQLLSLLPCQQDATLQQNQVHGILLQIKEMLVIVPELPETIRSGLGQHICDVWISKQHRLMSRENPCLLTRKEALEITAKMLTSFVPNTSLQTELEATLYKEISEESELSPLYGYSPGLSEFRMSVCDLFFNFLFTSILANNTTEVSENSKEFKKIEDVVVIFLKSDSYEVRRHFLAKIAGVFNGCIGNHEEHLRESKEYGEDDVYSVSKSNVVISKGVNSVFEKSARVHAELLFMVEMETHEDCQINLFRLLAIHPMTVTVESLDHGEEKGNRSVKIQNRASSKARSQPCETAQNQSNEIQTLRRLCQRLKEESLSDSLVAAILEYTGSLLLSACSNGAAGNQASLENQSAVSQLLEMVEEYSCSDCAAGIHLACAHLIQKTCRHLGCHGNKNVMFRVTLNLLQADDLEVREAASDVHCILSQNSQNVRTHPYVSVRLLMETWLYDQDNPDSAVKCLFEMLAGDKEKTEEIEERLFDRGEMNAYRDEMDFIQTVDAALDRFLETNKPPELEVADQVQHISMCSINHEHLSLSSMFQSTADYQKNILVLYRQLTLLKYGLFYSRGGGHAKTCAQVYQTVKQSLHCRIVPGLIEDLIAYLTH